MRATGIIRPLDEVGRVVIPKELRAAYNLFSKDAIEIFTTEDGILLKKYNPGCDFCGSFDNIKVYKSRKICVNCRQEIAEDI